MTATAWNSNGLIPDVFISPMVKDHLISTFVLNEQSAKRLSDIFDMNSVRRRVDSCVQLISGRVLTGTEQQQCAIQHISSNFRIRSKEFQDAVISALPTLNAFKNEGLQDMDNSTILALYLGVLNNDNISVHKYVKDTKLVEKQTTAQRRSLMEALDSATTAIQNEPHQYHEDFTKLCQLLMPNYYTVDGSSIVQAGR